LQREARMQVRVVNRVRAVGGGSNRQPGQLRQIQRPGGRSHFRLADRRESTSRPLTVT
jgi:hypothetical protein